MAAPTPVLTDEHLDLLVSAAGAWHVLASKTQAAFARAGLESHIVEAGAAEAGRLLRSENAAAAHQLAVRGRGRLVDRGELAAYVHHPVRHLRPVEVIKAAQAAQAACAYSPTWQDSAAQRLLEAVVTAGTHRLDGYADAPWAWTRPQVRSGPAVGVPGPSRPDVDGLGWVDVEELRAHWETAPLIVISVSAAAQVPTDLPSRAGVFLLVVDEPPNQVWQAVTALEIQSLVLFWPACQEWLYAQLAAPAPEFIEHRGQ